jgi:hypothetical protein
MAFHYRSTATMSTAVITTKEFKGIGHKQHCATCQHWVTNIKHHSQQFVPALEACSTGFVHSCCTVERET